MQRTITNSKKNIVILLLITLTIITGCDYNSKFSSEAYFNENGEHLLAQAQDYSQKIGELNEEQLLQFINENYTKTINQYRKHLQTETLDTQTRNTIEKILIEEELSQRKVQKELATISEIPALSYVKLKRTPLRKEDVTEKLLADTIYRNLVIRTIAGGLQSGLKNSNTMFKHELLQTLPLELREQNKKIGRIIVENYNNY